MGNSEQLSLFHTADGITYDYYNASEEMSGSQLTQSIKWRYAIVEGQRIDILDAKKGDKGSCPLCGELLVARKGVIRAAHWWHKHGKNCDDWYEQKGAWHRFWQDKFHKDCQEFRLERGGARHIADIFLPGSGYVIECQYSSISSEKAMEREDFYGDMIWIVNGTRVQQDQKTGDLVKERRFQYSGHGFSFCTMKSKDCKISPVWKNRESFVFFDFDGTFDKPSSETDVFCLLPDEIDLGYRKEKVLVRMSQSELVNGMMEPSFFLGKLRRIGLDYSDSDSCKRSRESYARFAAFSKERQRNDVSSNYKDNSLFLAEGGVRKKDALLRSGRHQDDVDFEKKHPPVYAITCGWLDLWLYQRNIVNEIKCQVLPNDFPMEGTIALHKSTSCDNFVAKREEWVQKNELLDIGFDVPPSEEHLKRRRGAIQALARYKVINDGGSQALVISDYRIPQGPIIEMPDGKGFWLLPSFVKAKFGKCGIILEDSRCMSTTASSLTLNRSERKQPKCPYCGAGMVLRKRLGDGCQFWGCSNFTKTGCRGTRSCNKRYNFF